MDSILRMHRVDCFDRAGAVTHRASLAERRGIRQSMHRRGNVHVASGTGRRERLNRVDRTLRIGHRVQPGQRQVVLLRAIDVAHRAIRRIGGRARRAQLGKQGARKVVHAASVTDDDIGPVDCLHVDPVMDPMHQ